MALEYRLLDDLKFGRRPFRREWHGLEMEMEMEMEIWRPKEKGESDQV